MEGKTQTTFCLVPVLKKMFSYLIKLFFIVSCIVPHLNRYVFHVQKIMFITELSKTILKDSMKIRIIFISGMFRDVIPDFQNLLKWKLSFWCKKIFSKNRVSSGLQEIDSCLVILTTIDKTFLGKKCVWIAKYPQVCKYFVMTREPCRNV